MGNVRVDPEYLVPKKIFTQKLKTIGSPLRIMLLGCDTDIGVTQQILHQSSLPAVVVTAVLTASNSIRRASKVSVVKTSATMPTRAAAETIMMTSAVREAR